MFSVVILAYNEAKSLPACLESLGCCDDIVVVDSGSTDTTAEVARKAGARVVQHPFVSFAHQRTFADRHTDLKYPWVFHLDADERFTPDLLAECQAWGDPDHLDGAYVAPRMLMQGKWLRRSTDYPAYQARFVHHERFRWIDVGHGQREAPEMRMAKLKSDYLHDFFIGGESAWLKKHKDYAKKEAEQSLRDSGERSRDWDDLTGPDALRRRRALKRLSASLPARPLLRFAYQYFLRGGVLDGKMGWRYCRLLATYEGFSVKARETVREETCRP